MKTNVHHSISLRGYDYTVNICSKIGIRTRKTSTYTGTAYKMIASKSTIITQ